jgi:hypothetical protein
VCTITGTVVKSITYDVNEYLSTASRDVLDTAQTGGTGVVTVRRVNRRRCADGAANRGKDDGNDAPGKSNTRNTHGPKAAASSTNTIKKKHTVSRCINFHQRVCLRVLCSETTTQCVHKEQVKLRNRLRWSFMRHVRSCKMRRVESPPNVIVMISRIAADIENYRLPIMNDTARLRRDLAYSCAQDIFKFTCSMTQSNASFTMNLDAATMVIGLLYLLRSGLVHNNMTVLPRCRALTYLLPPENYISMFGVKSKIITECENIVKCHLRTLTDNGIKAIGYEALDRVL